MALISVVPIIKGLVDTTLLFLNLITSVPESMIVVGPPILTFDVPYASSAPAELLNRMKGVVVSP